MAFYLVAFAFNGRNEDRRTTGNTLGLMYLLEGSVRTVGDDLRLTAQRIQAQVTRMIEWMKFERARLGMTLLTLRLYGENP